jgi:peptidoglycan hydrolase CwlO-like protein
MPARENIPRLRSEPVAASLARLEEAMSGMREDVSEIKASVSQFDHRVSYLEDVRVKAIEEREIRQNAIADERARAAEAAQAAAEVAARTAAEQAEQQTTARWSRRSMGLTALGVVAAYGSIVALVLTQH